MNIWSMGWYGPHFVEKLSFDEWIFNEKLIGLFLGDSMVDIDLYDTHLASFLGACVPRK